MPIAIPAVEAHVAQHEYAGTVVGVVRRPVEIAFLFPLQRGDGRDRLEDRPRRIESAHGAVDERTGRIVQQFAEALAPLVGIERGRRREREDGAVARIEDHACAGNAGKRLLEFVLEVEVDREAEVGSMLGFALHRAFVLTEPARVHPHAPFARRAGEEAVVVALHAAAAFHLQLLEVLS